MLKKYFVDAKNDLLSLLPRTKKEAKRFLSFKDSKFLSFYLKRDLMKKIILILAFFSLALNAQKIEVFAASSTSKLMLDLKAHFLKTCASCEINFVFGASGKHYQLLRNGRKFDLFFSADSKYPEQIQKDSLALLE